jgi:hypothetical protein
MLLKFSMKYLDTSVVVVVVALLWLKVVARMVKESPPLWAPLALCSESE